MDAYLGALRGLEEAMATHFYTLGVFVANNARKVQAATVFVMFLSMFGFARFHFEDDPAKLWVIEGSRSTIEAAYYKQEYGGSGEDAARAGAHAGHCWCSCCSC